APRPQMRTKAPSSACRGAARNEMDVMEAAQLSLLDPADAVPRGFVYRPALISADEEAGLADRFGELEFRAFEFHGYFGKRRVVSYGLHYDFADSKVHRAEA